MSTFLVCYKKRNNPRIDIRVCMKKCTSKDGCKEFKNYQETAVRSESQSSSIEPDRLAAA